MTVGFYIGDLAVIEMKQNGVDFTSYMYRSAAAHCNRQSANISNNSLPIFRLAEDSLLLDIDPESFLSLVPPAVPGPS